MEIYLKGGHTFPVPVTVAEHLLGLASHDQLKVLLYILCHADEPLTPQRIAQSCKVLPESVEEAVMFWQDANVLLASPEQLTVRLTDPAAQQTVPAPVPQPAQSVPEAPEKPRPVTDVPRLQSSSSNFALLPSEIAERINSSHIIAEMFRTVEQVVGRPLTPTEQKSLIWMNEYLGMMPDLIVMLAAFCIQIDCFHVRYMEKVALDWHDRGITTHTLVEEDLNRRIAARSFTGQMMKLFDMKRNPTQKQQSYFDAWCAAGHPIELIQLAYERCRDNKGDQVSFPYIDKVLEGWKAAGAQNADDVKRLDEAYHEEKQRQAAGRQQGRTQKPAAAKPPEDASFDLSDFDRLVNRF